MRLLVAALVLSTSLPAIAQETSYNPYTVGTVAVTGTGTGYAEPDMATIQSGVVTQAESAREALAINNRAMSGVIGTYVEAGIPETDISTSGFSVQPQYDYDPEGKRPPEVIGYQVSNTVTVRVRQLDIIGDVLDAAVSSGANQVNSLTFTVEEADSVTDQARREAIADARRQAELYADSLGVTLGRVLSVNEGTPAFKPPMPYAVDRMEMAAAPSSVPVQAGTQEMSVSVSVVWEIVN